MMRQEKFERKERERTRKREALEARIAALRKDFEAEEDEAELDISQDLDREQMVAENREAMARSRKADVDKIGVSRSRKKAKESE